jgi:precorrin-6B methylase 2
MTNSSVEAMQIVHAGSLLIDDGNPDVCELWERGNQMFWTKAITNAQTDVKLFKRNFSVFEVPDADIMLTSVMHILSSGLGYKISVERGTCVLGDGRSIPLMSYALVEYLLGLDLSSFDLLELGAGSSTEFWANCTKSVLALETDPQWVERLRSRRIANLEVTLTTNARIAHDVAHLCRKFDVVVIDCAANRLHLTHAVVQILNPGGFVILDNSDWFPNAARALRDADLIQVDFHDFRPLHHYRCTTSLFMDRAFRPKPKLARLPLVPIGGKDVADTNRWDTNQHLQFEGS